MSTPSFIGVKQGNSVQYISCKSDGYLTWVGCILQFGYTDVQKIKELLALGDLSSLGYNTEAPKYHFKDVKQARDYLCYMDKHVLTTFCLSYIRDMNFPAQNNSVKFCDYSEFIVLCKDAFVYFFDIDSKQWYIVTHMQGFSLAQVLSNSRVYHEYKLISEDWYDWGCTSKNVQFFKNMFEEKKGYSIIAIYNDWLRHQPKYRSANIKFGYATVGGKRIYALWTTKEQNEQKRRKPLICSACIGDLMAYLEENF